MLRHKQIKSQHAGPGGLQRQRECRRAGVAGLVIFFQVAAAALGAGGGLLNGGLVLQIIQLNP